jgi:hypothetical protein
MEKKNAFNQILAVAGVVLVWFPLLAPVLFMLAGLIRSGMFRFDYLMPAELFPFALAGGLILLWAALRAKIWVKLIAWGLGGAVVLLLGSQGLALVTGLANGTTEPGGWAWALVVVALVGFVLALVAVGVGGALLLRAVFKKEGLAESSR